MLGLVLLPAQSDNAAGDLFYKGYTLKSEAEKLEESGDIPGALTKYKEAQQLIGSVSQTYPSWNSEVVVYRLRMIEQAVARLQQIVSGSAAAAPQQGSPAPAMMAPAPAPQPMPAATPYQGPMGAVPQQQAPSGFANPLDIINQAFSALQLQNADLQKQIQLYEQGYQNMQTQHKKSQSDMESLRSQMKELMGKAEEMTLSAENKNEELMKELEATRAQAMAAKEGLDQKTKEFEESQSNVTKLETANEKLTTELKEMNQLVEEAKKKGLPSEDLAKLTAENNRLKKELEAARTQVEQLQKDNTKKDAEIASLRTQVLDIQKEMTKLRQENTMYQGQVAELTLKLKDLNSQIAQDSKSAPKTPEGKRLSEENKALKGIVLRQLRIQQRTLQAKELVMDEMKKSENTSQSLMKNLEDMTNEKLQLTEKEEALFSEPELTEIFALDQRVYATLQAPASTIGTEKSETTPAPAAKKAEDLELELLRKAALALQKSDYTSAAKDYQEVLRANPKSLLAIMNLAGIRLQEKKYSEVETLLKRGLVIEPDNDALHYRLGICYFQQSRLNDALSHFEQSAAKKKNHAKTHHYIGIISSKQGNRNRAESEFTSALAIDPNYGDAYFNLAVLYATANPPDWASAKKNYESALSKGVKPDETLEKLIKESTQSAARSVSNSRSDAS